MKCLLYRAIAIRPAVKVTNGDMQPSGETTVLTAQFNPGHADFASCRKFKGRATGSFF